MTEKIVVLSTCASEEEARSIAAKLIEEKQAACVNILPSVRSIYRWQGKVEDSTECLMIIKTDRAHFASLRTVLESVHSYELPEVLALPVVDGSPNYLAWLDRELNA